MVDGAWEHWLSMSADVMLLKLLKYLVFIKLLCGL